MKRLILFLIRRKLHVMLYEPFRFNNQKSHYDFYYITNDAVMKYHYLACRTVESNVSLNWLLNKNCKILTGKEAGFDD